MQADHNLKGLYAHFNNYILYLFLSELNKIVQVGFELFFLDLLIVNIFELFLQIF